MQIDPNIINGISEEFDAHCMQRHALGEEKYGPVTFLNTELDLPDMIKEELVDAANYLRYHYIRIRLMQLLTEQAQKEGDLKFVTVEEQDAPRHL